MTWDHPPTPLDPVLQVQDCQESCLQVTEESRVYSDRHSPADPQISSPHPDQTKDYKIKINITFPETEIEKKQIVQMKERIRVNNLILSFEKM